MARRKKRKIMSVDELYSFCLKNNFAHFSSDESGKELMVRMNGNFEKENENEDKHKEGLTPFISRAFHDHVNLNMSEISEESFNENVPSANFRPILAHITTNSDDELDFGSHDYYITSDKDGNDKVVYEEQPIGVIDGNKTSIEYDEKAKVNRAILHGYLYDEYCQDAIDILNRRGTVDCSIELNIRELSFNAKNGTLVLDDFYVSGLTLLSKDVNPGMAGSNFKIEDFAVDKNAIETFSNDKLVETLEKLTSILESFEIKEKTTKGGTELKKENFEEEVTENEEVTETEESEEEVTTPEEESEETVEESSEEDTKTTEPVEDGQEEPEQAVEEETEDTTTEESEAESFSKDELFNKLFDISFEDIRYALNALCSIYRNDSEWCYVSQVYDEYFIMQDWDSDKYYEQSYTREDDNIALTGERTEMFAMLLTESEKISIEEMRSNYAELKAFKEEIELNDLREKKKEILDSEKYEILAQKDEEGKFINKDYEKLVSEMDNYSLADLETEIKVLHSDYVSEHGNFALSEPEKKETTTKKQFVSVNKKAAKPSRYGKLFAKEEK